MVIGLPRDELIMLGILVTIFKVLVIAGVSYLFVVLFLSNWREAKGGRSLFAFGFCFGTVFYIVMIGIGALARGDYRPSPFILMVLFLMATAWAFNRVEIVNPLIDALILAAPLSFVGVALVGGVQYIYTSGSFFGHFANWGLTCAAITIVGAVRNYIYGR